MGWKMKSCPECGGEIKQKYMGAYRCSDCGEYFDEEDVFGGGETD